MRFLFVIVCLFCSQIYGESERRAAIDVGSGGTKLTIADVDLETHEIIDVLLDLSFPVPYQAALDRSSNGTFDNSTKELGLNVFSEIKTITEDYQVNRIVAIATSAFRQANNSKRFIAEIKKQTGISVQIIPQREEGEIAFFSALSTGELNVEKDIVVDVGTGSVQMTTSGEADELVVYMGEQMGAVAFKNYIISVVQDKEAFSPNPLSEHDVKSADSYVRSFARKAFPIIKEKIQSGGKVLGIGRLFLHSVGPIASHESQITRSGLRTFIENALYKTDEDLGTPFAHLDVSNCILTLAMMKALHIQEIVPIDTTTTRGLLIAPSYWQN